MLYSFLEERQEACNVIEIPPRAPLPDSKIELSSETAEVVSIKLLSGASCFFEGRLDSMPIIPQSHKLIPKLTLQPIVK